MKIIGCDLHARQQTIAMLDTDTGELIEKTLGHDGDEVRNFYSALRGPVLVGIEATGSMQWFLKLMEELGIECRVGLQENPQGGDPQAEVRSAGRRLLLTLLAENRFPTIWMLQVNNGICAPYCGTASVGAHASGSTHPAIHGARNGLRRGHSLWSQAGQHELQALPAPMRANEGPLC